MDTLKFGQDVGHNKKFDEKGNAHHFPGNTIVCILDHASEVFRNVAMERERLKASPIASCMTFLPDKSLHMTAIEGVVDKRREPERWTTKLPLDCPLVEVDDFFEKEFKKIPPLGKVRMRFDHLRCISGIVVALRPETEEDDKRIRSWRELVSKGLGLRFPGFETYEFHISMGYGIKEPDAMTLQALEEEKARFDAQCIAHPFSFEVPPASLTFFDDMLFFNTHRIPR